MTGRAAAGLNKQSQSMAEDLTHWLQVFVHYRTQFARGAIAHGLVVDTSWKEAASSPMSTATRLCWG